MLIGVISDTHDDYQALYAAGRLFRERGVSVVVHAGDWSSPFSMLKLRRALGPDPRIVTVFGNNDGDRYMAAKRAADARVEILGEAASLELAGRKIGVYHGTAEVLVEAMARSRMFHLVIYGHTHRREIRQVDGSLVLNPGEACGCATGEKTAAVVDLADMRVEIYLLDGAHQRIDVVTPRVFAAAEAEA